MKRDNLNYIVVGVFVLGLFVLLMVLLYQITGRTGPVDHYTATYRNIAGIKFGTPVLYEGYPVGQVETIEPVRAADGMRYVLTMSVVHDWAIPEDSLARAVASGLLATMTIEIEEGSSPVMLQPGAEIEGREASSLLAIVNDVAADFQALTRESIRPLLDNLGFNIDRLSQELIDISHNEVRPLLARIGESDFIDDLERLMKRADESMDSLQSILNQENQERVGETLANLQIASGSLDELLVNIDQTRVRMDHVLDGVGGLVDDNRGDLHVAVSDLRQALNAISANMDAISHYLEGSTRNLNEFTRQIRANPGSLLRSRPPEEELPALEESR